VRWAPSGGRNRELDYIDGEVRAGIITVEEIEELDEGIDLPALFDFERTRDAQVRLDVRRAAEFVEAGVGSIDVNAVGVIRIRDSDGSGALDLVDRAQFETAG